VSGLRDKTAHTYLAVTAFDGIYLRIIMTYYSVWCVRCGYSVGNYIMLLTDVINVK
jgi:hypothetical protein